MSNPIIYLPSRLVTGETEMLRKHSFTCWMSPDLTQASTDFCRNLGLTAIYAECSPEGQHRYLFWHPHQGALFEIRSGRSREQFEEFDLRNREKNRPLLSLHINEQDVYSAVWICTEKYETAVQYLAVFGILPAERKTLLP